KRWATHPDPKAYCARISRAARHRRTASAANHPRHASQPQGTVASPRVSGNRAGWRAGEELPGGTSHRSGGQTAGCGEHHHAGERGQDVLPALGFDGAVAAAAPGARIDDLGDEVLPAGLKFQFAVRRRRHGDFKGLTAQQNGENVGGDLDGVDGYRLAIQHHPPSGGSVFEFDNACIFSRWRSELDLVFHGRRSSCSRRPSSFQREGWSAEEADAEACFSDWLACQIAAAMTAASETALPR